MFRALKRSRSLQVGGVVSLIVVSSLLGIWLWPEAVKIYSPILMFLALGLLLYGATRR